MLLQEYNHTNELLTAETIVLGTLRPFWDPPQRDVLGSDPGTPLPHPCPHAICTPSEHWERLMAQFR